MGACIIVWKSIARSALVSQTLTPSSGSHLAMEAPASAASLG